MPKKIDLNLITNQLRDDKIHKYNLNLGELCTLKNFQEYPGVLSPNLITARFLANYLFSNNALYLNKIVIDMGCGSGIQGITAVLNGAKKVIFSDISELAVRNTIANIKQYGLSQKTKVFHGNLFEKIKTKVDVIIFNHPFFEDKLIEGTISKSLADSKGGLINIFLEDAKKYLRKNGRIIMPYDSCAGKKNCPKVQGEKHGYEVNLRFKHKVDSIVKKGAFSYNLIYELKIKNKK